VDALDAGAAAGAAPLSDVVEGVDVVVDALESVFVVDSVRSSPLVFGSVALEDPLFR
jgi:hypothetical protein